MKAALNIEPEQQKTERRLILTFVLLGTAGYGWMLTSYLQGIGRAENLALPACVIYGFIFLWKVKKTTTRPAIVTLTGLLTLNIIALFNASILSNFYLPLIEESTPDSGLNLPLFFLIFYSFGLQLAKLERWIVIKALERLPWKIRKHYFLLLDPHRVYHVAIHEAGHYLYALRINDRECQPVSTMLFRNGQEGITDIGHAQISDHRYIEFLLAGGIAETIFFGFQLGNDPLEKNSDYGQLRRQPQFDDNYASLIPAIIRELQDKSGQLEALAQELVSKGLIGYSASARASFGKVST